MSKIKLSLDSEAWSDKPSGTAIGRINNRIGSSIQELNLTSADIERFTLDVGRDGHTFCPATFRDGKRSKENFEQQQVFALDFDNRDPSTAISLEEVKARADHYGLPILSAYDTFSSTEHDKFRVIFFNNASISHRRVAEAMQLALGTIFPEADSSCYRDVSKMYFGGKERCYFDNTLPTINVDSVFRGMTYRLKDTKGNHYKETLAEFSRETGVALNKNGLLDVVVTDDPTEHLGATQSNQDGKFSPSAIIYANAVNIIGDGENFPKAYRINFNDCTSKSSVPTSVNRTDVGHKEYKNHRQYRASIISNMHRGCRLFREFEAGTRDMTHDELFGILTNLMCVDSGITRFKEIQSVHPSLYDRDRRLKWERHISYNKLQEYSPSSCNGFCPYWAGCDHGKNILTTVCPRSGMMERIPGYSEEFHSIEDVQEDTYDAINRAYHARDSKVHIIKSMTGAGKSYSYSQIMAENPDDCFLVAAPTNLLKNELYRKAVQMGIQVRRTPSLEEIKGEIPSKIWKKIQKLRRSGQHQVIHTYIQRVLEKRDIPCLREYMEEREALRNFHGSVITTHRYLLSMDRRRLKEFDAVIIDEDIIFKSIIPNQGEITMKGLEKLSAETADSRLRNKIGRLLKAAQTRSCIELPAFEYDYDDDNRDEGISSGIDIPSFCSAEKFYVRRTARETNLREDTIVFLKPANFFSDVKYIMVSATASRDICEKCWGNNRVEFYECKKAKYQGTLHQYPSKSMSRSSIANNPGIVKRLMNRFGMSEDHVITFLREKIGYLHFGNTEGSNSLEGQDILVVGTPYHADFLYKLAAFTMGLDFDEDEDVEQQIVTNNGYRFRFTTFQNEELRAIQFWMLESELEQAVGRARLLRNSCEVHLFSNFPLSQSEMVDGFDYGKGQELSQ